MENTVINVPSGSIEKTGILSTLKVLGYTAIGAFLTTLLATIWHFDFGTYQAIAMIVLPTGFKFIEKWLGGYNIVVTDPIVPEM